jgi:hypothetical protein
VTSTVLDFCFSGLFGQGYPKILGYPSFLANFVRFFLEASNEDREDDEDEGEDGEGAKATLGTNEPTRGSVKSKSRFF